MGKKYRLGFRPPFFLLSQWRNGYRGNVADTISGSAANSTVCAVPPEAGKVGVPCALARRGGHSTSAPSSGAVRVPLGGAVLWCARLVQGKAQPVAQRCPRRSAWPSSCWFRSSVLAGSQKGWGVAAPVPCQRQGFASTICACRKFASRVGRSCGSSLSFKRKEGPRVARA